MAGADGAGGEAGGSGDDGGTGDEVSVEAVPPDVVAEIETAVVDLIEASRRHRRPARRG